MDDDQVDSLRSALEEQRSNQKRIAEALNDPNGFMRTWKDLPAHPGVDKPKDPNDVAQVKNYLYTEYYEWETDIENAKKMLATAVARQASAKNGGHSIHDLLDKLREKHGEEMEELAEYMLEYGGWSLVTGDKNEGESAPAAAGGATWRWSSRDLSNVHINSDLKSDLKNAGHIVDNNRDNRFLVDYSSHNIYIDSSGPSWGADYLADAINAILKREDEQSIADETPEQRLDRFAKLGEDLSSRAWPLSGDQTLTVGDGANAVVPTIVAMGKQVAIDVAAQFGAGKALAGVSYLLKNGFRITGSAIVKGRKLIKFSAPKIELGKLFGWYEYVVANATKATAAQKELLQFYKTHAKNPSIEWVANIPGNKNGYIDTVTGKIFLNKALQEEKYAHLAAGVEIEELLHFKQLYDRGWIGRQLTKAESNELEKEVVGLIKYSGFKRHQ